MNEFFPILRKLAEEIGGTPESVQKVLDELNNEGVDIEPDNFFLTNFGFFYLKDGCLYSVAAYIVDRNLGHGDLREYTIKKIEQECGEKDFIEILHKVHLTNCKTLEMAERDGWRNKYKGTDRKTGKYFYRFIRENKVIYKNRDQKLRMCKNCVKLINQHRGVGKKFNVYNFDMDEYLKFSVDSVKKLITNCYAEYSSPNIYPDDFDEISKKYRESVGWKCKSHDCPYKNIRFKPEYLHTHHKNMDKTNNKYINLEALCIYCHSKKPNHHHIKNSPDYKNFVNLYGNPEIK